MPTVFGAGTDFLDVTDYIFLDNDVETEGDSSLGFLPDDLGPDCTGIVLHNSSPSLNSSAEVSIAPAPILSKCNFVKRLNMQEQDFAALGKAGC